MILRDFNLYYYNEILNESRQVELKRKITNYRDLNRELIAFLNDIGGTLYIGIDDDGTVLGLNEEEIERYLEEIPTVIYNGISPFFSPKITVKNIQQKQVIAIEVFATGKKPYFLKAKGIPEGVYIRIGTHAMPATPELIEEFQRNNTQETYDTITNNLITINDFDTLVLNSHYEKTPTEEKLIADKVVIRSNLTNKLEPTNSGILFFHPKPSKYITGAEVLFTKFNGTNMDNILRTKDYSSPMLQLIEEVLADLKKELTSSVKRTSAKVVASELLIPEVVLREVIVNALIHRKYFINDSIKIALFDNRLEIYSPGNFAGPITDFQSGASYSRNPNLRQLARNVGLVEKRGFGLPLIIDQCKSNNNPPPEFIEQRGDYVKVIIYFPGEQKQSTKKDELGFLNNFKDQEKFKTSDVAKFLNCSSNTARSRLKPFLEKKIIEKAGKGPASHFKWL